MRPRLSDEGKADMRLELESMEEEVLLQVLRRYFADLRIEVSNTDSRDLREALKQHEEIIKGLIHKLEQLHVPESV